MNGVIVKIKRKVHMGEVLKQGLIGIMTAWSEEVKETLQAEETEGSVLTGKIVRNQVPWAEKEKQEEKPSLGWKVLIILNFC